MQKWKNILLCAAVSFMFLFMAVGYAQLTDNLNISGEIEVTEMKAIYITDVYISAKSNTSTNNTNVTKTGTLTFKHNNYSLNSQSGKTGGSISITVTVKNNSGIDQYFGYHSATSSKDTDKLKNTKTTYAQSGNDRLIKQGETKTFTFTIQNTSWSAISMNNFESLLVFSPNFTEDTTMNATDALAKMFANVLSGKGPNGDGKGITYQGKTIAANKIMEEITKKMTGVDTGGYTGNVGNASQDEKDLMEAVFGDNITIQIGNNYYSVYILIKNQTIKSKDDMVIYVTADQLNMGSGRWQGGSGWGQQGSYVDLNYVPVYGLVFIKDGNGYKYCDHLFAGEAPVCDFGGAMGEGKIGNFNTNLWNSTEFSSVTNTSGGSISQNGITTNGELDEAYQYFIKDNPGALIDPGTLQ